MTKSCGGCGRFISALEGAKCSKCSGNYHRACVGMPDKGKISTLWQCPTCKATKPRDNNPSTPVRGLADQCLAVDDERPIDEEKLLPRATTPPYYSPVPELENQIPATQDIMKKLALAINNLQMEICSLNNNERKLIEDMNLLRMDLIDSREEVKALRSELREIRGNINTSKNFIPPAIIVESSKKSNEPLAVIELQPAVAQQKKRQITKRQPQKPGVPRVIEGSTEPDVEELARSLEIVEPISEAQEKVLDSSQTPANLELDKDPKAETWSTVVSKRRRRETVRGKGEVDMELKAVEKLKSIHLWSLKADTSTENVENYMRRKSLVVDQKFGVEKLQLRHSNYASFIVTVPESLFSFFMQGENWPLNARVNE